MSTTALTALDQVVDAALCAGLSDVELVDVIAAAKRAKRALVAVQAEATAALALSVRAAEAASGVRRGEGIVRHVVPIEVGTGFSRATGRAFPARTW